MMRFPPVGTLEVLCGLNFSRQAFRLLPLLLLLLLQEQPVAFVEGGGTSITSVAVGGSHPGAHNAVSGNLGGGATVNGDGWGPSNELGISFRSYRSRQEPHWNSWGPGGGRGWSVSSTSALTAVVAVAAALGVVFLLLSCGFAISRNAKATQVWGSRRRLSSREAEGPCEQTASGGAETSAGGEGAAAAADGEDTAAAAVGGAAAADGGGVTAADEEGAAAAADGGDAGAPATDVARGQEVSTSPTESTLDPTAAPFIPRGGGYAAGGVGEGGRAAGGDPAASAVSSLEATASGIAEGTAAGAPAAGEAAAAVGEPAAVQAGGLPEATRGRGEELPPRLWEAGVERAVGHFPFLGTFVTRVRELADYFRAYSGYLSRHQAQLVGKQLLRHCLVELAAVAPLLCTEEGRLWDGAVRALLRLGADLGGRYERSLQKATALDCLLRALHQLRRENGVDIPRVAIHARVQVSKQILPAAGAALRRMATAINTLLQSLQGNPLSVPPSIATTQAAVMDAVTEERLLQLLVDNDISYVLAQLQGSCCHPGTIFDQAHVARSQKKYYPDYAHPKAHNIDLAAEAAAAKAAAAAITVTAIAGDSAPDAPESEEEIAAAVPEGKTALGQLTGTGPEQEQGEQQLPQPQHSVLERQLLQPGAPAKGGGLKDEEALRFGLAMPPFPPYPPPMFVPVLAPGSPALQRLPSTVAKSSFFPQPRLQVGHQQQQQHWGPYPRQQQGAQVSRYPLQQQPQHEVAWGPFLQQQQQSSWRSEQFPLQQQRLLLWWPLQQHPRPWKPSHEHQRPTRPWVPFPPQQQHASPVWPTPQQEQQMQTWVPFFEQRQRAGPHGPFLQQLDVEPLGSFPQQQEQRYGQEAFPQQQQGEEHWGPSPPKQEPGELSGPFPQQPSPGKHFGPALPQQELELLTYAAGSDAAEEGSDLSVGLSGAAAYVASLLSDSSSDELDPHEQETGKGSDSPDNAGERGLLPAADFSAPAILLVPGNTPGHGAHLPPQQEQQEQELQGVSGVFQSTDYTVPTAPYGQTGDNYAQLPSQEREPQPVSGAAWVWPDVTNNIREDIFRGSFGATPHSAQSHASAGATPQTLQRTPAGNHLYADAVKSGSQRKPESSSGK